MTLPPPQMHQVPTTLESKIRTPRLGDMAGLLNITPAGISASTSSGCFDGRRSPTALEPAAGA